MKLLQQISIARLTALTNNKDDAQKQQIQPFSSAMALPMPAFDSGSISDLKNQVCVDALVLCLGEVTYFFSCASVSRANN
jgi:hypothetical protein